MGVDHQIAYNFERPMLVTNTGGLPEIVPDKKVGYVVNPVPGDIVNASTLKKLIKVFEISEFISFLVIDKNEA